MQPNKRIYLLVLSICFSLALVADAAIKTGDTFPDIATYKLEGNLTKLPKGKVILIDFWASWCGPCAQSFPVMEELQKTYGPQGLVVIAVSVDEKKSNMENFLKSHHVTFSIERDAMQKLVAKAGIAAMPSSFLIDKNGKVAFVHNGFHGRETQKQYEHEIELLLKQDHK